MYPAARSYSVSSVLKKYVYYTVRFLLQQMKISDVFQWGLEPHNAGCIHGEESASDGGKGRRLIPLEWPHFLPIVNHWKCLILRLRPSAFGAACDTRSLNRIALGPLQPYVRLGTSWNMLISFFCFHFSYELDLVCIAYVCHLPNVAKTSGIWS